MNPPITISKIKIGCLIPASGIIPDMGDDFRSGLTLGLNDHDKFEIIPEFIDQGKPELVKEKISKLISFDRADVLTGILSALVAQDVIEDITRKKIPLIVSNLGEYFPSTSDSKYFFYNGFHLWKSQWAIGKWAQETFGGYPAICTTIYDTGYHLHEAFRLGALNGGAQEINHHVLHLQPGKVDTSELISTMEEKTPTHVHAILCGIDGRDFIKRYKHSEILSKIPLTVSPFLVEDGLMNDIEDYILDIPNAILWSYELSNEENKSFVDEYEHSFQQRPSVFSLLGYENGKIIQQATINREAKLLHESIAETTITGPRGRINTATDKISDDFEIYLRRPVKYENSEPKNQIVKCIPSTSLTNEHIQQSASMSISGWQNPYLCI